MSRTDREERRQTSAVPLVLVLVRQVLGTGPAMAPLQNLIGFILMTFVYGGVPYAAFALWATWRIGHLSESEIQRQMMRAPLLMVGLFTIFLFLAGLRVGRPEFVILGPLAAVIIVPLGYAYVGIVTSLREFAGRQPGWIDAGPS